MPGRVQILALPLSRSVILGRSLSFSTFLYVEWKSLSYYLLEDLLQELKVIIIMNVNSYYPKSPYPAL